MAAVLSLLFSVFMALRCFTDDAKVNIMSSCSVAKFMLTTREGRGRLEARGCHFCIRGLSSLPAFVTLSPFRPLVLVYSVCVCVCVLALTYPSLGVHASLHIFPQATMFLGFSINIHSHDLCDTLIISSPLLSSKFFLQLHSQSSPAPDMLFLLHLASCLFLQTPNLIPFFLSLSLSLPTGSVLLSPPSR